VVIAVATDDIRELRTQVGSLMVGQAELRTLMQSHILRSDERYDSLIEAIAGKRDATPSGEGSLRITPATARAWLPILLPILAALGGAAVGGGVVDLSHAPAPAPVEEPAP